MIVLPLGDSDARILARGRSAPLCANHQRGAQHLSVRKRYRDAMFAALARLYLGAFVPCNHGFGSGGFEQSEAQLAVGEHAPQRSFVRFRREIDPARLHLVGHRDRFDRAAERFERRPEADMAEQAPARSGDRRGATVEPFGGQIRRIGAIDDMAGQALLCSRQRQRHADEAAADDQEVAWFVFGHVFVSLARCAAHARAVEPAA